jgi:hypothetical protein
MAEIAWTSLEGWKGRPKGSPNKALKFHNDEPVQPKKTPIGVDPNDIDLQIERMEAAFASFDAKQLLEYFKLRFEKAHGHPYTSRNAVKDHTSLKAHMKAYSKKDACAIVKYLFDQYKGKYGDTVWVPSMFSTGWANRVEELYQEYRKGRQVVSGIDTSNVCSVDVMDWVLDLA